MYFNSLDFAIFLPIVFALYWFVTYKNLKLQNSLIVAASYFFYGWWDWRFLFLILFSTLVDFTVGLRLSKEENRRKRSCLLWTSIFVNIGFLAFFKYYNFFLDNFIAAFSFFGVEISARSLNIILPVGISFYTFQTLSYTIDIYKRKIQPTRDFIAFTAFVSFFPQLVAGPIERAANLLPQFHSKRTFDYDKAVDGLRQMLWGLFKKVLIADRCAVYVDAIFSNSAEHSGSVLLLGAVLFAFQIYGDFSGYSDIAIGTSRLFGFNLVRNFAFPYLSRDIAEFWRRWHISLMSWFKDYLYIPLGGGRCGRLKKIRNTFIVFLVSGLWHGANWKFVAWGALNAVYLLPLLLFRKAENKKREIVAQGKNIPSMRDLSGILTTFFLTVFAWIFFRSDSVSHALIYISNIFSSSFFTIPAPFPSRTTMVFCAVLLLVEWFGRESRYGFDHLCSVLPRILRWAFYYYVVISILKVVDKPQEFIYFQF